MANSQDRQITAAGQTYTVRFGLRAILALQDTWQLDDEKQVQARVEKADNRDFATIMWAALRTHHPELTQEEVLGWLDDAGMDGMVGMAGQLQGAMEAAQPPARPRKGGKAKSPTP